MQILDKAAEEAVSASSDIKFGAAVKRSFLDTQIGHSPLNSVQEKYNDLRYLAKAHDPV